MKAIVLAAGFGTRLRPLTAKLAKPAIPFLNQPLIHHHLRRLTETGVHSVAINLHHLPQSIVSAVFRQHWDLELRFSYEPEILGTGGALRPLRPWLGDEPFLLINGDTISDIDLNHVIASHVASGADATMVLMPHPEGHEYSPVHTDATGAVCRIGRGWSNSQQVVFEGIFSGVHVINPHLLDFLPDHGAACVVTDMYLRYLANGGRISSYIARGNWQDLGTIARYLDGHFAFLNCPTSLSIQLDSKPSKHLLMHYPCLIDPSAQLPRGGEVGPYAIIGPETEICEGAVLRYSVVWEGCSITKPVLLEHAVVYGHDQWVTRDGRIS